MKKIVRTLCLVAMVALVATSCKKNEEVTEVNVSFGEVTGMPQNPSLDGSKAYIDAADGFKFKWNDGDQVAIYNLSVNSENSICEVYTADAGSEGQTKARFHGASVGPRKDIGLFVFYNATMTEQNLKPNNYEFFHVAETQNYNENYLLDPHAMVMACVPANAGDNYVKDFTLEHIFGFLNVAVANATCFGGGYQPRHVSQIIVTDGEWNLAGMVDLKIPEVNPQTMTSLMNQLEANGPEDATYLANLAEYVNTLGYHAHGSSKTITLNCNNCNLPDYSIAGYWQHFYIALRPGALNKGFTVKVVYNEATNANPNTEIGEDANSYVYVFDAANDWVVKPGHIRNIFVTTEPWGVIDIQK